MNKHFKDADFMEIISPGDLAKGKELYADMIKNYAGKCDACTGGSQYLPDNPKDYLNKVVEQTKRYKDKNGGEIFKEAKGAFGSQEGIWHTVQQLEKLDPAQVKVLDAKFGGKGLPCAGCRFDVELKTINVGDLKYIEYKSLQDASKITLDQFKNYLKSITNLNELNYVFSKAKLSLDYAKKGMPSVFKNNAEPLLYVNPQLFNGKKPSLFFSKTN